MTNPYEPPNASSTSAAAVVLSAKQVLPRCCAKCGALDAAHVRRELFHYLPPWVIVPLLLVLPIGLFIVAKTARKRQVRIRLCDPCARRWTRAAAIATGSTYLCVLCVLIGGGAAINGSMIVGCLVMVAGIAAAIWAASRRDAVAVRALLIEADERIHLVGLHPSARATMAAPRE